MRDIAEVETLQFPDIEITENFSFDFIAGAGSFSFKFKWMNDRWNCWVTFPDQSVRQAGVYPGVVNWTGNTDYGLLFKTGLKSIDFNSLKYVEILLITWL